MERVLGLNQSLVDSFARQQATPEPSSQSLGGATPTHTPPSKLDAGNCHQSGFAYLVLHPLVSHATMHMAREARMTDLSHGSSPYTDRSRDVGHDSTFQPIAT